MGLHQDPPRVVEVDDVHRVFIAAPRAGACLRAAGFSLVSHQKEDDPHGPPVHGIFDLSRSCDDCRAHAGFFLNLAHGCGLLGFARLDVPFRQDPQPTPSARLDEQVPRSPSTVRTTTPPACENRDTAKR